MRYGQIRHYDVSNGPGVRCSIFVTGCMRNCKDCFNKMYMDFSAGEKWTSKETEQIISYLHEEQVEGLTILGGEPFENAVDLAEVVAKIRKETKKSIWIYSGFMMDEILRDSIKFDLLKQCDVLIDGPFVSKLKDLRLAFRGSSNQRIIDIQSSLLQNEIIQLEIER